MKIHTITKKHFLRSGTALALITSLLFLSYVYANPSFASHSSSSPDIDRTKYERMPLDELRSLYNDLWQQTQDLHLRQWTERSEAKKLLIQASGDPLAEWTQNRLVLFEIQAEIETNQKARDEFLRERDVGLDELSWSERQRIQDHENAIRELENQKAALEQRNLELEPKKLELSRKLTETDQRTEVKYKGQIETNRGILQIIEDIVTKKFGRYQGIEFLWTTEPVNEPEQMALQQSRNSVTQQMEGVIRPKGNTLQVKEPDPKTKLGKLWLTMRKGLVEALYKKYPRLAAVVHRAFLLTPEEGKGEVKQMIGEQGRAEVNEVLKNEANAQLSEQVNRAMETVIETHANEVAEVCAEEGRKVHNSQSVEVKQRISWGRTFSQWWEKGVQSINEGKIGRFIWGLNILFISVFVWDVGKAVLEGKYEDAGLLVCMFITIAGTIYLVSLIPAVGAVLATGLNAVLLVWGLSGIYSRLTSFVQGLIDSYYESQYEKFILGREPCEMKGPNGQEVKANNIGFFTFINSPAYNLNPDTWFLEFHSRDELFKAIRNYRNWLACFFMGHWNVPPKFDPADNLLLFEKIIGRAWANKWIEYRQKMEEEMQKLRDEMTRRQQNLDYPLSNINWTAPLGLILGVKMEPENPTIGSEVLLKTYYAVTALPGDRINVIARSDLTKDGSAAGFTPQQDPAKLLEYKVAQAFKVASSAHRFKIKDQGDYEVTINLNLDQGSAPQPHRIQFQVGPALKAHPCGFPFYQYPDAREELNERFEKKMKEVVPSLPLYSQSNIVKQNVKIKTWSSGAYDVQADSGITGIEGLNGFSLRWHVYPTSQIGDPDDTKAWESLKSRQQQAKESTQNANEVTEGILGENSLLAVSGGRGTLDPNVSGDPYWGNTTVLVNSTCLAMDVSAGVSVHTPGSHGARDKPAVIEKVKQTAKEKAIEAAKLIHQCAQSVLTETSSLMSVRINKKEPSPGNYFGLVEKDQRWEGDPEHSMTITLKPKAGGKYEFEGEVRDPDGTYPFKGFFDPVRNQIEGKLIYPGRTGPYDYESVYGEYLPLRQGFKISHSIAKIQPDGTRVNSSYGFLCQFGGK